MSGLQKSKECHGCRVGPQHPRPQRHPDAALDEKRPFLVRKPALRANQNRKGRRRGLDGGNGVGFVSRQGLVGDNQTPFAKTCEEIAKGLRFGNLGHGEDAALLARLDHVLAHALSVDAPHLAVLGEDGDEAACPHLHRFFHHVIKPRLTQRCERIPQRQRRRLRAHSLMRLKGHAALSAEANCGDELPVAAVEDADPRPVAKTHDVAHIVGLACVEGDVARQIVCHEQPWGLEVVHGLFPILQAVTKVIVMVADPQIDTPSQRSGSNVAEYSVSELSRAVKRAVEDGFARVRVRGEISGFRGRHSSGHCYFSLKDVDATLDAVVWRSGYARLGVKPEEGLEVIATGRLTTFAKKSSYQLVVEQLEPAGVGALMKLLEERRKKLAAEGLFDEARKKPLPSLPRVIGVVTSPTGAVIRDILHRVSDRFPSHVVVWPVRVQGETSGAEVARAVEGFAGAYGGPRPDVLIVARGGGSVEDLWGYNDEAVVRAVAASPIPIISAVGHETDWTLIDHAADVRAPTPTGAAEMVLPVRADCLSVLADRARRLDVAVSTYLHKRQGEVRLLSRGLPAGTAILAEPRQRLDAVGDRLVSALFVSTAHARRRFVSAAARLSPEATAVSVRRARERSGELSNRLDRALTVRLQKARMEFVRSAAGVAPRLVTRRTGEARAELSRLGMRRDRAWATTLTGARARLEAAGKLLGVVSYQAVLARGFALVRRTDDTTVRSASKVGRGEVLELEFSDGRVKVMETSPRKKRTRRPGTEEQGLLF